MSSKTEPNIHFFANNYLSERQAKVFGEIYTVEEAFKIVGNGKAQRLVFTAMALCLCSMLMESTGVGFMVPAALCDLELDTFRIGLWTSIFFLGLIFTQHLWGFLADVYGRKFVILLSLGLSMLATFPTSFISNFWAIVFLRFFSGLSLAGVSSIYYVYFGEFYTEEERAPALILMSGFGGLSSIIMPGIAWILSTQNFSLPISDSFQMNPWRFQIIIQLIPGVLCLIMMTFLPESPRFLASVQKELKAIQVLQWIYEKNTGNPGSSFRINSLVLAEDKEKELPHSTKSLAEFSKYIIYETKLLLRRPYVGILLKCCFIQFILFFVCVGIGLWFPELANRISHNHDEEMTVCQIIRSTFERTDSLLLNNTNFDDKEDCKIMINEETYIANVILGVIYFIGFSLMAFITEKVHKNYITAVCLLISGLSAIILIWTVNINVILGVFLCLLVFSGVAVPMVANITFDLFPTHLRGMAVSLVILSGSLATFSGANIIGLLLEGNCENTFYSLSFLIIVASCISWLLPKNFNNLKYDQNNVYQSI